MISKNILGQARENYMIQRIIQKASQPSSIYLLLFRITLGLVFISIGWGKFSNFDRTIGYFSSINIPFPVISAWLAATTELVAGLFILVGLYTRAAAIPLAIVMAVATLTHLSDVSTIIDFLKLDAWKYFSMSLILLVTGAGKLSLDTIFKK